MLDWWDFIDREIMRNRIKLLAACYIDLSPIPRFAFDKNKYSSFKRKLIRWSSHNGASSSRYSGKKRKNALYLHQPRSFPMMKSTSVFKDFKRNHGTDHMVNEKMKPNHIICNHFTFSKTLFLLASVFVTIMGYRGS